MRVTSGWEPPLRCRRNSASNRLRALGDRPSIVAAATTWTGVRWVGMRVSSVEAQVLEVYPTCADVDGVDRNRNRAMPPALKCACRRPHGRSELAYLGKN